MAGADDENPPPPPVVTPTQQAPHTVSTIKLPILKKGEYDIWAMKMEHYLAHTDYPIWEVIQRGNGPVSVSTDTNGQIKVLPPKTAEEILARERERKARTTLLMAIPEDHLAKFHKMTDSKEMWEAIKSIFGGNDESKKMQKYILKQQFEGFSVSPLKMPIKSSLVAMISIRLKKFYKKTWKKLQFDAVVQLSKEQEKSSFAFVNTVKHVKTHSFGHLIRDCNFHEKRMAKQVELNKKKSKGTGQGENRPDDPQQTLKGKGIVDSGCSRHMTGNKAYLVKYQEFKGGSIAFGGSKGKITRKGKIRTGKLDFEDVYFVKELQYFNLFSLSQMCEKKNKVLFTDTECLVLSPDFKLPDENQVLLRGPRQNNMYSFNLENIVPTRGLACLVAKATVDESNKWHRRLSHVNFKNLNKLVKGNLVRGKGPNWLFDLDYLTDSMNYQPVIIENKANKTAGPKEANNSAGTQDNNDVGNSEMEVEPAQEYFVLPLWSSDTSTIKSSEAKNGGENPNGDIGAARASSTNYVNTASTPVNTASPSGNARAVRLSYPEPSKYANQDDSQIPALEDIYEVPSEGIFTSASYDDEGAVADFTNLETIVNVSLIPQSRIHSIHPTTQILGDPYSAVQTRSKVNKSSGAHDLIEPKKISQALEDESKKEIGTKWVYRNKKDERGVIVRNKARLVTQGHRQEEGIDYDEVFAPMARIEAIRIFLAFASYMGFIVYQMDVKSAFLYGTTDEEVYVSQPLGFIDPKFPKKVYKVVKALYGLHQAPIAWYDNLFAFLEKSGYKIGTIDKTLFIKRDKKDIMLVQVFVDDIIFGSTKKSWCDEFEALIKSRFQMSYMGKLTFFLGLQVKQKEDGIFISKDKYVAEILKKFDFMRIHDRFQVTLKTSHLHAMKKIFRYLKGKPKLGLWYPRVSAFDLEAYSDSDYDGENLDRKSTTRGCQFLGRRLFYGSARRKQLWLLLLQRQSMLLLPTAVGKDAYEKKLIQVLKIHTHDNVADLLTKAFDVSRFNFLIVNIGMLNL
ncbi:putative ribonuclease H-like domain-containing protein [Tanacetum coccineum]